MHPRNIYKDNPPDFKELAIKYSYFRQYCRENTSGAVIIDFKDPAALRALTCALLENDFDLKIEIPLDRLIPTVPLRLNYILWVEDLVGCLPVRQTDVIGVDIGRILAYVMTDYKRNYKLGLAGLWHKKGTGSSCIYPLLGAKLNDWKFLATEVDESSLKYAENNIKQNGLTDKITVQQVSSGSYLCKPLADANQQQVTFCMCNPPFFSSEDEAVFGSARTDKRPLPQSVNTGSTTETVTSGGEVEFVKQIIDDSLQLQEKVSWYTTMVGKKSSMKSVLAYLREKKVPTVTTTTFHQGKTMRWGLAWTFLQNIFVDAVSPPPAKRPRKQTKALSFLIPDDCAVLKCNNRDPIFEQVVKLIKDILMDLKIVIEEEQSQDDVCSYRCSASQITWTHQRKKRRELQRLERLGNTAHLDKNKLKDENNCELKAEGRRSSENVSSSGTSDGTKTAFEQLEKTSRNISESIKSIDNSNSNQRTLFGNLRGFNEQGLDAEERGNTLQSDDTSDAVKACLCSFWVRLSRTTTESKDQTLVEVECVQANNKNDVYQLYQYLGNKILKGK